MAFLQKNLALLACANGFSLWHYKTSDTAATVDTTGYFNNASTMLAVGDRIMVSSGIGGTPAYGDFVVLSNSGGVVDVGDAVAIGGTDTD